MTNNNTNRNYKNTEPAVDEIYNPVNNSYLKRSKNGQFTHPIEAFRNYKANVKLKKNNINEYNKKVNNITKNFSKNSNNNLIDNVATNAFLNEPNLTEEIVKRYVKLRNEERIGKIRINDNKLTDYINKVDAFIDILDKDGNIIDSVMIDFKHENKDIGHDLTHSSIDYNILNFDDNGKMSLSYLCSPKNMSQIFVYGILNDYGLGKKGLIKKLSNDKNFKTNMQQIYTVNRIELNKFFQKNLKTKYFRNIFISESQDIYNIFKQFGFEKLAEQTMNGDGIAYNAGYQCFQNPKNDKYFISKFLDDDENIELVLKDRGQGKFSANIRFLYSDLKDIGLIEKIK